MFKNVPPVLLRFGLGAFSGLITVFLAITYWQTDGFSGGYWPFLLIISIIGSLFLGLFPGGIGGLIIGGLFKKYKYASLLGGVIVGLIEAPFLSFFGYCALMGGC